jgi:hypothetical protein
LTPEDLPGRRIEVLVASRASAPARFPVLAALGEYAWADNRDERFTANLDTLVDGLRAGLCRHHSGGL